MEFWWVAAVLLPSTVLQIIAVFEATTSVSHTLLLDTEVFPAAKLLFPCFLCLLLVFRELRTKFYLCHKNCTNNSPDFGSVL